MGASEAAFGISLGSRSGIVDLLRFVAKRVKYFKTETGELIADLSGSERYDYHLGGIGYDVQLELELYDDIEGPTLLYGYHDCLDKEDFKLKEFPDFRIGFPTGCGSMMYVANCEHASEESVPPETLRRLIDVYEKYWGSDRMKTNATICLKIPCCS